jgi:hypothetical protein
MAKEHMTRQESKDYMMGVCKMPEREIDRIFAVIDWNEKTIDGVTIMVD